MQLKVEMQEILLAKEEQEEVLRRRERELTALKGALKEEVAAHDQEVDKMKDQYEKEISRLQTSLAEAKQVISHPFVCPPSLPPSLASSSRLCSLLLISFAVAHPHSRITPCYRGDKRHIRGAVTSVCFALRVMPYVLHQRSHVGLYVSKHRDSGYKTGTISRFQNKHCS